LWPGLFIVSQIVLKLAYYENSKPKEWRESKSPVNTAAMFLIGTTSGRPV